MGKYAGLKQAVPRQVGHEPPDGEESGWNDLVVKEIARIEGEGPLSDVDVAATYSQRRNERDAAKKEASRIGVAVEAYERILIKRLEDKGLASIGLADGETFRLDDKPVATVVDPDAFIAWVKANGMENLLTMHANTRKAVATQRFEAGLTETPGLELKVRTTIIRQKSK